MSHRIALEAEADLNEIWYFVAVQSGSFEISDRVVDSILDRFILISRNQKSDAVAITTSVQVCVVFRLANM